MEGPALGDLIRYVISSRLRVDTWGWCPTNYSIPFCLPDGMHISVFAYCKWSKAVVAKARELG